MLVRSYVAPLSVVLAFSSSALVACDRPTSRTETTGARPSQPTPVPEDPVEQKAAGAPARDPMSTLDADMKAVMDQLAELHGKPIPGLSAVEARQQPSPADAVRALLLKQGKSAAPEEVGKVTDRTIPGRGGPLPVRVYTPKTGKAPFPVVVYFHGGGFVIATIDTYDSSARGIANGAGAMVVAVEYRKAPESKFPAAHDDALTAYEWTLKNAATMGGDPKKIALVGESAGGNLAASVSMAARDKKEPLPVYEVLVYPIASSDTGAPSYLENANAKPLDKAMMGWFTGNYVRMPADAKDPRIDLVDANLAGLPPTLILNAEVDPLRSDGEALATRMRAAGVTVDQKTYAGVTHEFFGMGAAVSKAKDAMEMATSKLKTAFAR